MPTASSHPALLPQGASAPGLSDIQGLKALVFKAFIFVTCAHWEWGVILNCSLCLPDLMSFLLTEEWNGVCDCVVTWFKKEGRGRLRNHMLFYFYI